MNAGYILLAVWLILTGLTQFGVSCEGEAVLLAVLAIAAGIMFLVGDSTRWRRRRRS